MKPAYLERRRIGGLFDEPTCISLDEPPEDYPPSGAGCRRMIFHLEAYYDGSLEPPHVAPEAKARLAVAVKAPEAVRLLLAAERNCGSVGSGRHPNTQCCGAAWLWVEDSPKASSQDGHYILSAHAPGCELDAFLTSVGLPGQKSRDAARVAIKVMGCSHTCWMDSSPGVCTNCGISSDDPRLHVGHAPKEKR